MSSKWLSIAGLIIIGGAASFAGCVESTGTETAPASERSVVVTNATVTYDNDSAIITGLVDGVETSIGGAVVEASSAAQGSSLVEATKCYFCVEGDGVILCKEVACP